MATRVNPAVEVLTDADRVKDLVVSLNLIPAAAWDAACRMVPAPRRVSSILQQLGKMPGSEEEGASYPLLSDFQIRQILAGYGERLRLGDCLLSHQAGANAYGENFYGRKLKPARPVVVQTFFPPETCDADEFASTVVRRARELTSLHHPMLPIVLEIGSAFGFAYVAMERRHGRSIWSFVKRAVRKRQTIPLTHILTIVGESAGALDHLHTRRWCHGELCPDAILLEKDGTVWLQSAGLLDLAFECFAATAPGNKPPEHRQWWAWNASYCAPEVREGQIKPTPKVDVYSLGAVLYFLLSGKPFTKEQASKSLRDDWRLTNLDNAPLETVNRLERLLGLMLSKKPSNRPTAKEVQDAVDHLLSELTIPETCVGPAVAVPPTGDFSLQELAMQAAEEPSPKSSRPASFSQTAREAVDRSPTSVHSVKEQTDRLEPVETPTVASGSVDFSRTALESPVAKPAVQREAANDDVPTVRASHSSIEWFDEGCRLLEEGKPLESVACFDGALAKDDTFWQAWYNRGLALRRLWRMEEASESFRRATSFVPKDCRSWFQLGVTQVSLGEYAEAVEAFDLARWLGHPHAEAAVARCREEMDKAAGQDAAKRAEAKRHASAARSQAEQKRLDLAMELYSKSLELDPTNFRVWYDKGVVCSSLERMAEAIDCFSKSVELNPEYRKAWYNKGVALVKLGSWGDALPCFEKAKELGHPMADQAAQACRKKISPRRPTPAKSAPFNPVTSATERIPEPEPLPDQDELAHATNADTPEAQYLRKSTKLLADRLLREAVDCLDHALAHNPYYWEAWYAKARAWLELSESEFAANCLRRVVKLNSECASAWYELGRILLESGARTEARQHFERARECGHPGADGAIRTLEEYESLSSHR